jgi:hypothetical protein
MRGNGNPLAPPSADTEARVAAHLRQARGKSPVFLARRYRLALTGYITAVSRAKPGLDHDHLGDYADLDARTITALKIVGLVAKERARFATTAHPRAHRPDPYRLVGESVADVLEALANISAGTEPPGMRTYYATDERAPPYVIVADALGSIAERGTMD